VFDWVARERSPSGRCVQGTVVIVVGRVASVVRLVHAAARRLRDQRQLRGHRRSAPDVEQPSRVRGGGDAALQQADLRDDRRAVDHVREVARRELVLHNARGASSRVRRVSDAVLRLAGRRGNRLNPVNVEDRLRCACDDEARAPSWLLPRSARTPGGVGATLGARALEAVLAHAARPGYFRDQREIQGVGVTFERPCSKPSSCSPPPWRTPFARAGRCSRAAALYPAGRLLRRSLSESPVAFAITMAARHPERFISRGLYWAFTHRCGPRTRSPRQAGLCRWASPTGSPSPAPPKLCGFDLLALRDFHLTDPWEPPGITPRR
jgi:hypothetical protein